MNLAWCSAVDSRRRTLLWDLDAQGAAARLLGLTPPERAVRASGLFDRSDDPADAIVATGIDRLDLLPADTSLRELDRQLFEMGKRRRLAKLIERLSGRYDRIVLDCPPGLTAVTDQVLRATDILVVPMTPAPLVQASYAEVVDHVASLSGVRLDVLPVLNMIDRRRGLHRAIVDAMDRWPVIPMASVVEQMGVRGGPVGQIAPGSPAAHATATLWRAIERRIARGR